MMKFKSGVFSVDEEARKLLEKAAATSDPVEKRALEAKASAITHSLRPVLERGAANLSNTRYGAEKRHEKDYEARELTQRITKASYQKDKKCSKKDLIEDIQRELNEKGLDYPDNKVRQWANEVLPPALKNQVGLARINKSCSNWHLLRQIVSGVERPLT